MPTPRLVERIEDGKHQGREVVASRYDVVPRREISPAMPAKLDRCQRQYGWRDGYAVSKRQPSTREIKGYGLR